LITQREVAKHANVSVATVSRYINKKGYISPEIKNRILEAIERLQYKPNLIARSLKIRSTNTLGLIFPDIENEFFIGLIKMAEEIAHKHGYNVILCNTENKVEKERIYIEVLKGKLVDGYIIIPATSIESEQYDVLRNENVVYVDRFARVDNEICIKLDNKKGVRLGLEYLTELGHTRIGIVNVPQNVTTGYERYEGYREFLLERGVEVEESLVAFTDYSVEGSLQETVSLLQSNDPPTALFTMSGPTTAGALLAMKQLGLNIPRDVSIIGFDELEYAELLNPPLTVIVQPAYEFGRIAAETLLKVIRKKRIGSRLVELEPTLQIRGSCAGIG
jgi:DNA-binding LacI/PurR family transcriptional regulator